MPPRTVTAKLGALLTPILEALVRALAHVSADVLTMTGLALTGVLIPTRDPESFLRASADAGLLRIIH